MSNIYTVEMSGSMKTFPCKETESIITAMMKAGVNPFPIGCRGGGCGVCRIQILEGKIDTGAMSRAFVSKEDELNGFTLACRAKPRSNLKIKAPI